KPAICLKSSDDGQQEAQTIGLDLRDCANREFSIGVAAGAEKHAVVRACIWAHRSRPIGLKASVSMRARSSGAPRP
ncbi:MAG: hypothetical protein WAN05_25545, partial [Roseiarcus sp.]